MSEQSEQQQQDKEDADKAAEESGEDAVQQPAADLPGAGQPTEAVPFDQDTSEESSE